MNLLLPTIWYPSTVTAPSPAAIAALPFVYPPRKVPDASYSAVRYDNVAASGVKEVVYVRTDSFLEFEMEYVKIGADVAGWDSFMQSALQGIPFDYYPDGTTTVAAAWQASHAYALNAAIRDAAGHIQKATTAGTSGSSAPAFSETGGTTSDGSVVWTDQGADGAHTVYTLEGTTWKSNYKQLGMYTFSLKFRVRVAWP